MFSRGFGVLPSVLPTNFQDRLVVTASIFLRVNSFTRRGYRCGSEIYFGIRFATFAKGEIFLRANEKVIKLNILDIVLDVPVFAIVGLTKKSMFSRLLEVLSSDRPINFQDRLVVTASIFLRITATHRLQLYVENIYTALKNSFFRIRFAYPTKSSVSLLTSDECGYPRR